MREPSHQGVEHDLSASGAIRMGGDPSWLIGRAAPSTLELLRAGGLGPWMTGGQMSHERGLFCTVRARLLLLDCEVVSLEH